MVLWGEDGPMCVLCENAALLAENEALKDMLTTYARRSHSQSPYSGHAPDFEWCGVPMCRKARTLLSPQAEEPKGGDPDA
jgi:hypothetical protein